MGTFPRLTETERAAAELPAAKQACADYKFVPIGYKWEDMRYEMRLVAIAMAGIPSPDHPSAAWTKENLWSAQQQQQHNHLQIATPHKEDPPLFPNTELDDAMLHFRRGDLIHTNHPSFGFMKFGSFSRHVSKDVCTIGIATQPFEVHANSAEPKAGPLNANAVNKAWKLLLTTCSRSFPPLAFAFTMAPMKRLP